MKGPPWIVDLVALLDPWFEAYAVVAMLALLVALIFGWAVTLEIVGDKTRRKTFPVVLVVLVCGLAASAAGVMQLEVAAARQDILLAADARNAALTLDGSRLQLDRGRAVLDAIRHMDNVKPDHSVASDQKHVLVVSGNGLERRVVVCTDTADPANQWVFYERFMLTASNPIGHAHFQLSPP